MADSLIFLTESRFVPVIVSYGQALRPAPSAITTNRQVKENEVAVSLLTAHKKEKKELSDQSKIADKVRSLTFFFL